MTLKAALLGCGRIGCEFDSDASQIGIYTHAAAYRAAEGVDLGIAGTKPFLRKVGRVQAMARAVEVGVGGILERGQGPGG